MKLNCDLGEKVHDNDAQIMPYIDFANIACGFHASDPLTIKNTVKLAVQHKVVIGAHPSYPDKENFGRRSMQLPEDELVALLQYQIGALQGICASLNTRVQYVKPHGALYNDMMASTALFATVCKAVAGLNSELMLMVQALPNMQAYEDIARSYNLALYYEAFADRAYTNEGALVSRQFSHSVIHDHEQVIARCAKLFNENTLVSEHNQRIALYANTLCVHGDNPAALELVKSLSDALSKKNNNKK